MQFLCVGIVYDHVVMFVYVHEEVGWGSQSLILHFSIL